MTLIAVINAFNKFILGVHVQAEDAAVDLTGPDPHQLLAWVAVGRTEPHRRRPSPSRVSAYMGGPRVWSTCFMSIVEVNRCRPGRSAERQAGRRVSETIPKGVHRTIGIDRKKHDARNRIR